MTRSLRSSAHDYADLNWPVFPLRPHHKAPLTKHGVLDASTDHDQIDRWWQRWPNANIGAATGISFDVFDIDGETGRASLEAKAGPGWNHPGPVSRTGKGQHWLYAPTNTNNKADKTLGLDWRGHNGYIVVAPSIHPGGERYEWLVDHGPRTTLPNPPDWLSDWLVPHVPYVPPKWIIRPNPHDRTDFTNILAAADHIGLSFAPEASRYKANCIFHTGDNEPSLKLYTDKNDFHCHACHAHGSARNLSKRIAWRDGVRIHSDYGNPHE